MSTAVEIVLGGRAPKTAEENTAFHRQLLADLIAGAKGAGWHCAEISYYDSFEGAVAIGLKPVIGVAASDNASVAPGFPGLEQLRAFRETHGSRIARPAEPTQFSGQKEMFDAQD